MYAQYFALNNLNLNLQICAKARFSHLLILLGLKFQIWILTSWYPDLVTSAQSVPGVDMLQGWMMASTKPQTPALHLQYQRFIIKDPVREWRHSCVFRCSSEIFHILLFWFDNRRVFYTRFYFENMFLQLMQSLSMSRILLRHQNISDAVITEPLHHMKCIFQPSVIFQNYAELLLTVWCQYEADNKSSFVCQYILLHSAFVWTLSIIMQLREQHYS